MIARVRKALEYAEEGMRMECMEELRSAIAENARVMQEVIEDRFGKPLPPPPGDLHIGFAWPEKLEPLSTEKLDHGMFSVNVVTLDELVNQCNALLRRMEAMEQVILNQYRK